MGPGIARNTGIEKAIEEAEKLRLNDEKRYKWIYLGEIIGIEGLIYNPDLFIIENEDYTTSIFDIGDGMSISVKK